MPTDSATLLAVPHRHRGAVIAAAAALPALICALLVAFGNPIDRSNATLVLVVVVVAGAATGIRAAGLAAAVSAACWFDLLLAPPVHHFAIAGRSDLEAVVLLLAVGVLVTELALWGRRRQADLDTERGLLEGIVATTALIGADGPSPDRMIADVGRRVTALLDAEVFRFVADLPADAALVAEDGTVERRGRQVDVERTGLPTDSFTALPVEGGGERQGYLLVGAPTRVARPTAQRLRIAGAAAHLLGEALHRHVVTRPVG